MAVITDYFYEKCLLKIEVNNSVLKLIPIDLAANYQSPIQKITVLNSCKIKITCIVSNLNDLFVFDYDAVN